MLQCSQNRTLLVELVRITVQHVFEPDRGRGNFDVAAENVTICNVSAIEFPVGFTVWTQRGAV